MMKVAVKHDFENLQRTLDGTAKQVRFATARALTQTAKDVKKAEEREMADVFDRPTRYTLASVYFRSATTTDLTAEVGLKNFAAKATPAASFLLPQIVGGSRKLKRFERALQAVGALPDGYRVVPGTAAKLDANGNISRGQIVQILSYFRAFPEAGYKANMTEKRRQQLAKGSKTKQGFVYFVGQPGDRLPLGVWQRLRVGTGTVIKPIMIFVPSAAYESIFDFTYVGQVTVNRNYNKNFEQAFDEAMRSARP